MTSSTSTARISPTVRARAASQWLALGAVLGPVLFTGTWLVLGFLSPGYTMWDIRVEEYSVISQPVSGLGLGVTAPYMNAAFIVMGILCVAGAVGIFCSIAELSTSARWTCTALLAPHGLGGVLSGIFTLESIMLHSLGFLLALTPIVSFLVIARQLRRIPAWRRLGTWLLVASPLTMVLTVLYFATFDPQAAGTNSGIAGLTERLLLVELQAGIVAMGWLAFRRPRPVALGHQ
jgi:hypothetical protein